MTTVAEGLEEDGHAHISTIEKKDFRIELHIEEYTPEDDLDWEGQISVIGKTYEMALSEGDLQEDTTYSISNVAGNVVKVKDSEFDGELAEFKYISLLTDRGENGEVIVPDEPYDEGSCEIPAGVYRVYELKNAAD